jgi:toxin-antitoxin system PIN domain toxin
VILLDVNVLVYAHRTDAPNHDRFRDWLASQVNSDIAYGMADIVLSGFIRIVTHPHVFQEPTPLETALTFAADVRDRPNCIIVHPGERHWEILTRLCSQAQVRGNMVADAYLAALAVVSGSEWITTDRDYARFPGLRWRHPLSYS